MDVIAVMKTKRSRIVIVVKITTLVENQRTKKFVEAFGLCAAAKTYNKLSFGVPQA